MSAILRMCPGCKRDVPTLAWACTDGRWAARCHCGYSTRATTLESAQYAQAHPGWTDAHRIELEAVNAGERMGLGSGITDPVTLDLISWGLARWDAGRVPLPARREGVVTTPAGKILLSLLPLDGTAPPSEPPKHGATTPTPNKKGFGQGKH